MAVDIALVASLFAIGNIMFGHFEERTPKWRRLLKFGLVLGATLLLEAFAGSSWARIFVAAAVLAGLTTHFVMLRRFGINPWTAEPRDKYYAMRGWTK
jgi:hypothetical protein